MKSKNIIHLILGTILLSVTLGSLPAYAADAGDKVIASYEKSGDEATRAISWNFVSEQPLKERQIAQTFKSAADGNLRKLVFPLIENATSKPSFQETNEFTVTFYDHGQAAPEKRPTKGNKTGELGGIGKLSDDGSSFIITLDDPYQVLSGNYYSFALEWKNPNSANKISLQQKAGTPESFRWHRDNRSSWIKSPDSLIFRAVAE